MEVVEEKEKKTLPWLAGGRIGNPQTTCLLQCHLAKERDIGILEAERHFNMP